MGVTDLNERRVIILFDDYFGGAGNMAQLLGIHLSREYQMEVILSPTNEHSSSRYDLSSLSLQPCRFEISGKNPLSLIFGAIVPLWTLIRNNKPDLVISFLDRINCIACAALLANRNIPLVVSERNDPLKSDSSKLLKYSRDILYHRADAISVQFEEFRSYFSGSLHGKTYVTPNIVRMSGWKTTNNCGDPIRLVSMGRLTHQKRFDQMLNVARTLKERELRFNLSIYGDGPLHGELSNQIRQEGLEEYVVLAGKTKEVDEALSKADLFLLTSEYEGFPNVVGEAMAVGLPVVAYGCHAGMNELIENAGVVVSFGETEAMADAVCDFFYSPKAYAIAREHAFLRASRYSTDRVLADWEKCLRRACGLEQDI